MNRRQYIERTALTISGGLALAGCSETGDEGTTTDTPTATAETTTAMTTTATLVDETTAANAIMGVSVLETSTDADGNGAYEALDIEVSANTVLPGADEGEDDPSEPYLVVELDGEEIHETDRLNNVEDGTFTISIAQDQLPELDAGEYDLTVRLMDEDSLFDDEIATRTITVSIDQPESTTTVATTTTATTTSTPTPTTTLTTTTTTATPTPTSTPTTTTETAQPTETATGIQGCNDQLEGPLATSPQQLADETTCENLANPTATADEAAGIMEMALGGYDYDAWVTPLGNGVITQHISEAATETAMAEELGHMVGAYAGVEDNGYDIDFMLGYVFTADWKAAGSYQVQDAWIESYNAGDMTGEEVMTRVFNTIETYE